MSMLTPTGNPWPYELDHFLYLSPINVAWIDEERRHGETDQQVIDRIKEEAISL